MKHHELIPSYLYRTVFRLHLSDFEILSSVYIKKFNRSCDRRWGTILSTSKRERVIVGKSDAGRERECEREVEK